jgi:branched-chain amino acid transport system substrate-binding protein
MPYFYDGVMLIAAAMKAANSTDPAKYMPALAKIKYDGITANIAFDDKGDLTQGLLTIFEVKNGKWEVVSK